ncbi:FG-GAP-like repeat-containing protein [Streptomyces sp. NPDC050856]|uniref:FG-GAP-like repeat-containing protein n=1 Tax=Streptomyces sp. NPDC050856 TaxID=3154939 RepID=UPI0033E5595D
MSIAGFAPLPASATTPRAVDPGQRLDITPHWRTQPRSERVAAVDSHGYVHSSEPSDGSAVEPFRWTSFTTGESTPLGHSYEFGAHGTGSAHVYEERSFDGRYIRDMVGGTERRLDLPEDLYFRGLVGGTMLLQQAKAPGDWSGTRAWLLGRADDPAGARPAITGWPEGADLQGARLVAGDDRVAVLAFDHDEHQYDATALGVVDLASGRMTVIDSPVYDAGGTAAAVAVSPDALAWVDDSRQVHVRDRAALEGPERTFPLPADLSATRIGLVGGWILASEDTGDANTPLGRGLVALSADGLQRHLLLDGSEDRVVQITAGGAAVVGGTSSTDWHLQKVTAGADGGVPRTEKLRRVAPVAGGVDALALSAGVLTTVEREGPHGAGFYTRALSAGPAPDRQAAPVWIGRETGRPYDTTPCGRQDCARLFGSGDGRAVHEVRTLETSPQVEIVGRRSADQADRASTGTAQGTLVDSFGRYAVVQTGGPLHPGTVHTGERTLVVDLEAKAGASVVRQLPQTGAALWGNTLYTGSAAGSVSRTDLPTGRDLGVVSTGTSCLPTELQVTGPWLYWACAYYNQQGVVDLRSGTRIALPAGSHTGGLLGDGFFVDKRAPALWLTDFRTGTPVSRRLADVDPTYAHRNQAWSVDRFGGGIAYKDTANLIHVVPSGVPTSPLTAVTSTAPAAFAAKDAWRPSWWLSKPAASWRLTVKHKATGAVVRALAGGETRGPLRAVWDGKDSQGRLLENGPYAWSLVAVPADGQGASLTLGGTVQLAGGTAPRRDHAGPSGLPDTVADLVSLSSSGALALHHGNGTGALAGATTGGGWPTTVVAVPFGDLNGDRCNDVLVRTPNGELRGHRPACGKPLTPTTPYTSLGTAWAQFNVLTSPGDLTGDGRPDLIARQTTTGDIHLYADNGAGGLKARGRIAAGWKGYRAVLGAGDLNGDGAGDLLAVDGANTLWRFDGTAAGTLKARVQVFGGNWAAGRNTLIGVGDLNKDGRADLLSRNTAGDLLRNYGNGAGSFGGTVKIGSGWQNYKGLF